MTYPITDRTYFDTQSDAWSFAQMIAKIHDHWIVSDYGIDQIGRFFVETMNDPFSTKDELLRKAGLI